MLFQATSWVQIPLFLVLNRGKSNYNQKIGLFISSSSKHSIVNFLKLLKTQKSLDLNFKLLKISSNKTLFSVLKSPHVNKSAQEQFHKVKFTYFLTLNASNYWNTGVCIKLLKSKGFSDLDVICKYYSSDLKFSHKKNTPLIVTNPDLEKNLNQKNYLNLLEAYGEAQNAVFKKITCIFFVEL